MNILAIETSCDETAAAIIQDGRTILGESLASQIPLHRRYGGVVPELASRAHLEALPTVLSETFAGANLDWSDIDTVAATAGPGLFGSLLVGFQAAQTLAWTANKPFIPVNHLAGHLYANWLAYPDATFDFPLLGLIISGGHTMLIEMDGHHDFRLLGQTLDDAAGEAFDKVASLLGLPYPGGPEISKLGASGDIDRYKLPRALTKTEDLPNHRLDFSFSGLKTATRRVIAEEGESLNQADLAASFEEAVVDVVVTKLRLAARSTKPKGIITGGGVMANERLRTRLTELATELGLPLYIPPLRFCTDNAAVMGAAASFVPEKLILPAKVDPNLALV